LHSIIETRGYRGTYVHPKAKANARFAVLGSVLYWFFYVKKVDPLQTHADRMGTYRMLMHTYAWMCIAGGRHSDPVLRSR
jgi:hypothetical protein